MSKKEKTKKLVMGEDGIYDASVLGVPKMMILGFQHVFAMFGATTNRIKRFHNTTYGRAWNLIIPCDYKR